MGRKAILEGERLFQRTGRGREAFPEGRECSRGRPSGPAGVGSPSWRADRGQEALHRGRETISEGREGLGGPFRVLGGFARPS